MAWEPNPQFDSILLRRAHSREYYKESMYSRLTRWRRRKLQALSEAQNHRCAYCGKHTHFGKSDCMDRATLDHLIPLCKGKSSRLIQTNKDENLIMACAHCNAIRGHMNPMKFYNKIRCKPLPPMIEKKESKFSKDPEKLAHQKVKQGRLLKTCWVMICFWPENAQAIIEYKPKNRIRKKYDQHINEIRLRIYDAEIQRVSQCNI